MSLVKSTPYQPSTKLPETPKKEKLDPEGKSTSKAETVATKAVGKAGYQTMISDSDYTKGRTSTVGGVGKGETSPSMAKEKLDKNKI